MLFVLFVALAYRLRVRDMDFVQEADFWSGLISSWVAFLGSMDVARLPPPAYQPYLDGIYLPYALGSAAVRGAAALFPSISVILPIEDSFNIAGATAVNILAYVAACTVFYAAIWRITRNQIIAVLAALAMFFSPQMIAINLIRVDFLIILPIMLMFYCSVLISQDDADVKTAVILGVASAFAATMKINGLFFLTLPMTAAASSVIATRRLRPIARVAAIAAIVFALGYAVLMARYWYFLSLDGTIDRYRGVIASFAKWSTSPLMSSAWSTYYNLELVVGYGTAFIVLYLACGAVVALYAVVRRDPVALFLFATLALWSLAGSLTLKYTRGGYHLIPVFLACIAYVAGAALQSRRWIVSAGIGAIMLVALVRSVAFYEGRVREIAAESPAFQIVKREPREWIAAHVRPGETVCIPLSAHWALPINDLGLNLIFGPFDMPYLEAAKMATFAPPDPDALPSQCPLIVLEDFHVNLFNAIFKRVSPDMASRWTTFYKTLSDRWPPRIYESKVAAGGVTRVEIYDLREGLR